MEQSEEGPPTSLTVSLKQDTFFGFHNINQVGVGVTELLDVTFYAILWTRPAFGARGGGADLWTEWGAGVNFGFLDGDLSINPQFGVLNGTLLSGSDRGLVLEGIVPNLTVSYFDGLLEGQLYGGWYIALRDDSANDFLHYWGTAGFVPISWLSFGVHWEHLVQTRGAETNDVEDVYMWLGPYIEAKAGSGFLRFSGGVDLAPDDTEDFYQVTVGMNL